MRFNSQVMLAVGICAVVTLGLTLFAFQTKIDFTMMGGVLLAATLILMIFGIVLMFWHGKSHSNVTRYYSICFWRGTTHLAVEMHSASHCAINEAECSFLRFSLHLLKVYQLFLQEILLAWSTPASEPSSSRCTSSMTHNLWWVAATNTPSHLKSTFLPLLTSISTSSISSCTFWR